MQLILQEFSVDIPNHTKTMYGVLHSEKETTRDQSKCTFRELWYFGGQEVTKYRFLQHVHIRKTPPKESNHQEGEEHSTGSGGVQII